MAVFNPQLQPPNDPNYLGYSRSVEGPSPDLSGRIRMEGAADLIKEGAAAADQTMKKQISNEVYEQVDQEREKFTEGLEGVKKALDNNLVQPGTQKSLLDANASMDEPVPPEVDSGVDRITQLTLAKRSGSIKLNDTQYSGNVLSIAKQLRAQYPTYREYIDQKVSQASGLPVANSYYQNMMLDINRQLSATSKQKDDLGEMMKWSLKEGNEAMVGFIQKRMQDPNSVSDAQILSSIGRHAAQKAQLAVDAAARESGRYDIETQKKNETANLTRNVNNMVSSAVEDNIAISGMPSLRSLISYFDDYSAGRLKGQDADTATVQQRAEQLLVYKNYYYKKAKSLASPADPIIGNKQSEEIIQNALTPITTYTELMKDKQLGPAAFHQRQIQAVKDDETYNNWLFDKDRAAISRRLLGAREVLGEQYFPEYIKSILGAGTDKPIADLFSQEALSAVMPVEDQRGKVNPRYMTDAFEHAKKQETNKVPFEYYGGIVEWTQKITDPMMPLTAKDRLVDWAFNAKNQNVMDHLKMDYRDPNTGQWVPGKYRAFNIMTSPGLTQSIAETSKVNPENYRKYQDWAEVSFSKLYREDLQTLNKVMAGPISLTEQPGKAVPFSKSSTNPGVSVHFSYNSDTKEFGLVDKNNRPITRDVVSPTNANVLNVLDTLERVNSAAGRLAYVNRMNPAGEKDTDKYLLQVLQTSGFRPGSNLTYATEGMAKALIMSKTPELTPEQLNERFLKLSRPVPVQGFQ